MVSFLASFLAASVGIASAQQQPMTCGPGVNVCGIMTLESGFGAGNYKVGGNFTHAFNRLVHTMRGGTPLRRPS